MTKNRNKNEKRITPLDGYRLVMEKLDELDARIYDTYSQISKLFERYESIARTYFRLIGLYVEHGVISPEIIVPEVKNQIEKDILLILFDKPQQNISEITERLREKRGKASRRIVREKLKHLEELDVVEAEIIRRKRTLYSVSKKVIEKWSQVLSGFKYEDHG